MTRTLLTVLTAALLLTACSPSPAPPPPPSQSAPTMAPAQPEMGEQYINEPNAAERETIEMHEAPDPAQQQPVVLTADQFIQAWLDPDPVTRARGLEGVASSALLEGFTDPRFRPLHAKPAGPIHIGELGVFQASTVHRLDGGRVVELTLVLEPDAPHGWQVITITER